MAIREDEGSNAGATPPRQPTGGLPPSGGWSFHDGGLFASPIPKGIGSEYYNKLRDNLVEIYKAANKEVEIGVVELSRAVDPALDFSTLLVATRLRDHAKLGVAFHILLVTETGEEIPTLTEQVYDRPVTVFRVPSDAINKILIDKAERLIRQNYPAAERVYFVDGTVVPKTLDPNNKNMLQGLALNAAMAGVTELQGRRSDFEDLNLAKLNRAGQATVEITFLRQQLADAASNIYRSDVLIGFTDRRESNQRERQLNTGDRQAIFSELSSFVDCVWYPMVDPNAGFATAFMPQHMAMTQKFVARQVITNIKANYSQTPGSVLLALSTSLSLRNPAVWIQAFRPLNTGRNEVDITDIGALNIEANIPVPQPNGILAPDPSGYGKPIDTKADDFKSEQLGLYVAAIFNKELMIAMDIPEFGPQTQYLSLFSAASRGVGSAIDRIIGAASELTAGEFIKHFNRATPIFATNSERIHAGTWVDINGQIRDLRDFDHVAVANIVGKRQPQMIRDWSDTFLRVEYPEIQRLEARRKLLMHLSNDTAKFTGFYQRVTFTGDFLKALDAAIASHQLRVNIRTPMSGSDFYNQRGVASYAQSALLGYGPSFLQQGGYSPTIGTQAGYFQYRW